MTRKDIRVLIVDDHEVVRTGLRTVIDLVPGIRVIGDCGTAAEAVGIASRRRPHVVLLDIRLPDISGIDACKKILAGSPRAQILILSSYAEEATVVSSIRQGAQGYALKDIRTDDLIRAIRTVATGQGYLDQRITRQTLTWIKTHGAMETRRQPHYGLSPQEERILPLVAQGKTNKEIAVALGLSDKTVKNYLANIYDKLQVHCRSQAASVYAKLQTS